MCRQATVQGFLLAGSFLFISRSKVQYVVILLLSVALGSVALGSRPLLYIDYNNTLSPSLATSGAVEGKASPKHLQRVHSFDGHGSILCPFCLSGVPGEGDQIHPQPQVSACVNIWCVVHYVRVSPFSLEDVDLEKEFEQNELNSAVYLISIAMQISNFAVNYKVSPLHKVWPCPSPLS